MLFRSVTDQQKNGLEDLRLVRFDHGDKDYEWIGTYTAYSGHSIRSELLRTRDFTQFKLEPIHGRAGRNKGMALFPEKIDGQYAMVGRQDGKNLYLIRSDTLETWDSDGEKLMGPKYPWEFIQIGNCGSPIRTAEGWSCSPMASARCASMRWAARCSISRTRARSSPVAVSRC